MIKKLLFLILVVLFFVPDSNAQELNATLTVNSDKIEGNRTVFATLERALNNFINTKQWTDATFGINERIDCTFLIIVNEMSSDNSFRAELQVQARRPVYNSAYTTTLINYRDTQLDFDYTEYEPLEYNEYTLDNNLVATITFYIYTILGLDFDSFSPRGGTAFHQQAQQIVNLAQSQSAWTGWRAFESNRNRHAVSTALTENTADIFRDMWYTYHRWGLDEMAANPDRGRTTVLEVLPALEELRSARPNSILLQMFVDSKLDEVIAIYSKATVTEKQAGYKMLTNLFPTQTTRLEPLKN
ncbi:MAG: DUF4835 family protein [Tannerellaceae bacterium]|nr:DUF4835 family protein [Tannerellaceae bacterium]